MSTNDTVTPLEVLTKALHDQEQAIRDGDRTTIEAMNHAAQPKPHAYNGRVYFGRCWCGLPRSAAVHAAEVEAEAANSAQPASTR